MKQIISALGIAGIAIMASCNTASVKEQDTALQAQQKTIDSLKLEMAKQQVIDSMNEVANARYVIPQVIAPGAMQTAGAMQNNEQEYRQPARRTYKRPVARKSSSSTRSRSYARNRSRSSGSSGYGGGGSVAQSSPVYQPAPVYQEVPQTRQKRGWSAKAKGAVIGAGTGAVAGAVINKRNRAAGAVIGGVLGAGAGTGIGAIIDRKNGR